MLQLYRRAKKRARRHLSGWRDLALPGVLIVTLICLIRLSGLLQVQEWMALDTFSRSCQQRPLSEQITLVTIDEADYQSLNEFPVSNPTLAIALSALQQYEPRAIGLDLFKSLPDITAQDKLHRLMRTMPNVVAAEVALSPTMNLPAPAGMPPEQVGFKDIITDSDGKMRRIVLATSPSKTVAKSAAEGTAASDTTTSDTTASDTTASDTTTPDTTDIKYSLALQLVRLYLKGENISFSSGATAREPIRFGDVVLPQFHPNSGGYVRANASGNQVLMNFCMLQQAYETISLRDLLAGNVNDQQLRDRIVIVGNTVTNAKESFVTAAVQNTLYSNRIRGMPVTTKIIYGIEVHAHAVKQLLNSVLVRPCVLATWPDSLEYLWIVGWGLLGIGLSIVLMSPWKSVVSLVAATFCLLAIAYTQLNANLWIPVVPAALALCGAGLVTALLDRDMRFELAQQKIAIERTYEAFHNGPLQRLAAILRSANTTVSSVAVDPAQQHQLQALNLEMRSIFERMRQETKAKGDRLYLIDNTALDLTQPLPELLYQVYDTTLNQPLPGFTKIESYIFPDFECLSSYRVGLEQKRGLCLFLQEGLINVGKYAIGATRLDVRCTAQASRYQLQIIDNGSGGSSSVDPSKGERLPVGQGTLQAQRLASQLKGTFRREHNNLEAKDSGRSKGTLCELT